MAETTFHFRQFSIRHDRCAMKVGTDGVLLGAWCSVPAEGSVLDIGTGSGLIALMVAQRAPRCTVTGIDIDADSLLQAADNAARSPFADRVRMELADVLEYQPPHPFSAIVCNPPFYTEDTLPPDGARAQARNAACLPLDALMRKASQLLATDGTLSLIVPYAVMGELVSAAMASGLSLCRRMTVRTVQRKPPKRVMLTFCRSGKGETREEEMVLNEAGGRSAAYALLCRDFYL